MIDIKAAVRIAIDYLREFHEFIPVAAIRLEETEYDDAGFWLITLSTLGTTDEGDLRLRPERIYKQFRVDAETGKVKWMKVRAIEPAE